MILNTEFDRDVICYAFRYALGRNSYAPYLMMRKLDEVWNQLDEFTKELILREILEHKKFLERINKGNEWSFNDNYDLSEWMNWRKNRIRMDKNREIDKGRK